ncbi:MAG: OmpA family protein [Acidimicrobiales bacterium]
MTSASAGRQAPRAAVVMVIVFAVLGVAPPGGPSAAQEDEADGVRVRDLEYQVRDLEYQWRALDNSERVEERAEETTITFAADVLFEFDRADLTAESQSHLDALAATLDDLGPRTVTISGYTDSRGEPPYNLELSQRRAEAVRNALSGRLAGEFSFDVTGYGEDQPVAANENEDGSDNPEGRALNRRVEIQYPTD